MPHILISLPPTEAAKVEAYLALWQQWSPGMDRSGVITRMIEKWPWVTWEAEPSGSIRDDVYTHDVYDAYWE